MSKLSAGILLYRLTGSEPEFFLVHPGGPFFAKKNEGWWTIPKGEPVPDEDLLACAQREFKEETGYAPTEPFKELQPITQKAGKKVHCWAAEGNLDAGAITSNSFEMEWPPKSGRKQAFPEIDRAGWFPFDEAKVLINERQSAFLLEVIGLLSI